ncbi:hypothetical protein Kfla_4945 [Kribbella flavida DSM 17836]|uniref:Uncharacterized protein n=1 Tax=Kribbella flavida (strain DSM 17836 / JCM 10339 / NBRC 14399) TaxID=479435 RepID=D2Q215_KRIFD|nr:hypothetical protein [Kribbella flavida]ADB33961.1 hypothetical protein Kfla_4945 [Kribbella flavida DSM 17836]
MSRTRLFAVLAVVGAAVAGMAGLGAPAAAGTPPTPSAAGQVAVQQLIDEKLRKLPGGRQVGPNKIVWEHRGASLEFGTMSRFNCQYEYFCLYGDSDYNDGPDRTPWKLTLWTCGWHNLGDYGVRDQTSSVVNNQTPGTRAALHHYHADTNPEYGTRQMWSSAAYGYSNLVYPNDEADHATLC